MNSISMDVFTCSPVDQVVSGWNSLINSDGMRNVGNNLSHISSQMASQAEHGYTVAAQKVSTDSNLDFVESFIIHRATPFLSTDFNVVFSWECNQQQIKK